MIFQALDINSVFFSFEIPHNEDMTITFFYHPDLSHNPTQG